MEKIYLKNNMYMIIFEDGSIRVYDSDTNDEYLPYRVNTYSGSFLNSIKEEIQEILNEKSKKNTVLNYLKTKENAILENPFEKSKLDITVKINNKWFALLLTRSSKVLNINDNNNIEILNLKNDEAEKIVNNINIFPAYHMNKKKWISILIDKMEIEEIKKYIDISYNLVLKK